MKKSRKLMSILLIVAMLFTLAAPAMAEMEGELTGGSITINDAVSGQTYNAYQILYLESYNPSSKAYAYKANSQWESWLRTQTNYVEFNDQGYVTWKDGADVVEFAKSAKDKAAELTADATQTVAEANPVTSNNTVAFTGLKLGYYLVDTTLGALCSLDTTNPDVKMEEKNAAPTVTKEVQEDSNSSWGETNDADINQVVDYKATITVQAGAENYKLYDNMSAGLTWDNKVTVSDKNGTVSENNYTVNKNVTVGEGEDAVTYDFVIEFKNSYIQSLSPNDTIIVSYSATLNEGAVVAGDGNDNTVVLKYGDSNTVEAKTTTYTWDMNVLKYGDGDKTKVLAGAEFVLLNSQKDKVATIVNGKLTGWVGVPAADGEGNISWPDNTTLTTNDAGEIAIKGLDADTYHLREIKAPDGYNKLNQDTDVIVTRQVSTDGKTMTYTKVTSEINNQSGAELPSTGGMGTTIFYVIGGALVLGAAVLLVTRRRMAE